MAMELSGWTVIFRDGAPAAWQQIAQHVVAAGRGRFTPGDANRGVRFGNGFLDLVLEGEAEARRIEQALTAAGIDARALHWTECEAADPPTRHTRLALEGDELVPGLPARSVQFIHLVLAQSAPFFLPPEVNAATQSVHRIAGVVNVLGLDDSGAAGLVTKATGKMMNPGAATTSAPELVVELCGLWAPRVHLPVDSFEYAGLPGATGGRRERLGKLLEALVARLPRAKQRGFVEDALARRSLDGLRPLPTSDHRRLVMAWLTSLRLWPTP